MPDVAEHPRCERDQITGGDSAVAAMLHTVEQLNAADGGYHGWTYEEILRFYFSLTSDETEIKISQNTLDRAKVTH